MTDKVPVFSAPKYCDTTENKGAYINIGPELKLEYHQFEAVPHPDIKPMVSYCCENVRGKQLILFQAYAQNSLMSMM